MRTLSDAEVLRLFEAGAHQHPLDRLLTLLQWRFPARSRQELADLTIGQRDAFLLDFREAHFGRILHAYGECPACGEKLEFSLDTAELRQGTHSNPHQAFTLSDAGFEVTYRLPTSRDLAVVVAMASLHEARGVLLERCVLGSTHGGLPIEVQEMPADTVEKLMAEMARQEPQADITLALTCPGCAHSWEVLLDIGLFVWHDLQCRARRLLQEVHILASAYGWSESDILALTPTRRQAYVDLVLS